MNSVASRVVTIGAAALALGLAAFSLSLAVLAGSIDGRSPSVDSGAGCPAARTTTAPGDDGEAVPQQPAGIQNDDQEAQLASAGTVPAGVDADGPGECDPLVTGTTVGSNATGAIQDSGG